MQTVTFRNSYRHLGGTLLTQLTPMMLAVVAFNRYASSWSGWWFELLLAAFLVFAVPVAITPVWAAKFRTLTIEGDVITMRWGWFSPETRATTVSQVSSIQVDEPLSQRLSAVRAVTIFTSGAVRGKITMPALTPRDAAVLKQILDEKRLVAKKSQCSPVAGAPHASDETDSSSVARTVVTRSDNNGQAGEGLTILYKAGVRDIIATTISGGYIIAIALAAAGAAQQVISSTWVTSWSVSWFDPRAFLSVVTVVILAMVVLVFARFNNFRINKTADGQLRITYGAAERVEHTIAPGQVVAVTLVRTPVDLLLRTTRLVFSTAWRSDGDHKRLVFPSMSADVAQRVVTDALGRPLPDLFAEQRRWRIVGLIPLAAGSLSIVIGFATGLWSVVAVAGVVFILVSFAVMRYVLSEITTTAHHEVVCRTTALTHRVTIYSAGTVSALVERRAPVLPLRNVTVVGWAHRRFVHRVPTRSASTAAEVRVALRESTKDGEAVKHWHSQPLSQSRT